MPTNSLHYRALTVVFAILATLFVAGCFDIEQSVSLQKDMSGKASFRMGIDFEPMILIMTQMKREMDGKTGPATSDELAAAKKEFLDQMKKDPAPDLKKDIAEANKQMPEGIKMLDADVKQEELKLTTSFSFSFDDLAKLKDLKLPSKEGGGGSPTDKSVVDRPFEGLVVKDEGDTILITSTPVDPAKEVEQQSKDASPSPDNKEMEQMVENALKGLRVAWKIDAPFKVVDTNATRKAGNSLIWEYTYDSLKAMEKQGTTPDALMYVRYKK